MELVGLIAGVTGIVVSQGSRRPVETLEDCLEGFTVLTCCLTRNCLTSFFPCVLKCSSCVIRSQCNTWLRLLYELNKKYILR